jgi:hypothetical protein
MKKAVYESPEALIVCLKAIDVITTSLPEFEDDDMVDDGWIPA